MRDLHSETTAMVSEKGVIVCLFIWKTRNDFVYNTASSDPGRIMVWISAFERELAASIWDGKPLRNSGELVEPTQEIK